MNDFLGADLVFN